jgi:hypothetical protein
LACKRNDVRTTMIYTHVLNRGSPGREKPGGQPLSKERLYIIRKPYKTQNESQDSPKPLIAGYLCYFPQSVLSKSKTQKRVYLETI